MTCRSILLAISLPLLATPAAQATFIGAPIQLDYVARDGTGESETFVTGTKVATDELGTAVEFPAFAPFEPTFDVDVDASTIRIDHFVQSVVTSDQFLSVPFLGLVFSDATGAVPPIQSVTVVPSADAMAGLVVTHNDDVIEINWAGQTFTPTTRIDLAVTFAPDVQSDPLPEPATLVANGVFAMLLVARRFRRSTNAD